MRALYIQELDNPQEVEEEEEEGEGERDTADFGGKKLDVVGLDGNKLEEIKREITARRVNESGVVSIVGMAGTGRTVIAKSAFENKNNRFYDIRAWITVGPVYELKEIINSLLSQIDGEDDDDEDEKSLGEQVYTKLKGRRYLIVLDNVCDTQVWDHLRSLFPSDHNRSRVLLTTGLDEVVRSADSFKICTMDFMDEAKSWDRMCDLVFGCPWCPPELEEAGKKIANNCEGRPLEIIKVALLLRGARNTPESWNKIAADQKQNDISIEAYDEMSEISQITGHLQWENLLSGYYYNDTSRIAIIIQRVLTPCDILYQMAAAIFLDSTFDKRSKILSLFGMAGIGKTTLAKEIFEDPSTRRRFDHCVWVTLGPRYQHEKILVDVLAQIDPEVDKMSLKGDENLAKHICTILSYKSCLFVLDDIWDNSPLDHLQNLFKDPRFVFLLTTRLRYGVYGPLLYKMRLLNKEESWRFSATRCLVLSLVLLTNLRNLEE